MHVVWHYHVAANSNIVFLRFRTKRAKCIVHFWPSQEFLAFIRVKRDEIERAKVVEQAAQPRRSPRPFCFVARRHDRFLLVEKRRQAICTVATALCRRGNEERLDGASLLHWR